MKHSVSIESCGRNEKQRPEVSSGDGLHRVSISAVVVGSGLVVVVSGGTTPHIGAVAIAIPRPSLKNPSQLSCSTSVYCVPNHKDDEVAKQIADRISPALNRTTVVTVGLHVDAATPEEIQKLTQNSIIATEKLIAQLMEGEKE